MKLEGIREAVNLGGSIASITGVSLLWLQTFFPKVNLLVGAPVVGIAGLFSIGLLSLSWVLFRFGYVYVEHFELGVASLDGAVKVAYCGVVGAVLLLVLGTVLSLVYGLAWVTLRDLAAL
jgi:hypothetical protein